MSEELRYLLIGGAVLFLLTRKKTVAASENDPAMLAPVTNEHERPHWGANWISNQWAHIMQGQAATSGQVRPGWHF